MGRGDNLSCGNGESMSCYLVCLGDKGKIIIICNVDFYTFKQIN